MLKNPARPWRQTREVETSIIVAPSTLGRLEEEDGTSWGRAYIANKSCVRPQRQIQSWNTIISVCFINIGTSRIWKKKKKKTFEAAGDRNSSFASQVWASTITGNQYDGRRSQWREQQGDIQVVANKHRHSTRSDGEYHHDHWEDTEYSIPRMGNMPRWEICRAVGSA